jgi:hypothetical protein
VTDTCAAVWSFTGLKRYNISRGYSKRWLQKCKMFHRAMKKRVMACMWHAGALQGSGVLPGSTLGRVFKVLKFIKKSSMTRIAIRFILHFAFNIKSANMLGESF